MVIDGALKTNVFFGLLDASTSNYINHRWLVLVLFFMFSLIFYLLIDLKFQKIIPFHEITSVRRAKAVAVFPTAIEIIAGGKKVPYLVLIKTMIFHV